ncbi:thioredoxin [Patescibacteria group bacterium]|nr:thioredoxin [Patescibacteria group bacterium]MBU1896058.1 thioredoxin [Patescibacteria group bacterium]
MPEITFSDNNFENEVLKSSVPVFVDFWAPWCGPCQMIGPIVEELGHEYEETQVKIGKLNVDENQNTTGKYEVMSVPTFVLFKNGEVADKIIGGVTKEKLKEFIEKNL